MPRSKRKAAQAVDFAKKKTKLGRKSRAANATDTSVKSRQVYIRSHEDDKDVAQLLARAKHHNANARLSAFGALLKRRWEGRDGEVASVAMDGVMDVEGKVRRVAEQVVVECSKRGVGGLESGLLGLLSHSRREVRVSGARVVARVEGIGWKKNPLEFVGGVLGEVEVLECVASLCEEKGGGVDVVGGEVGNGVFYYHRKGVVRGESLVVRLEGKVWKEMVLKCCYLSMECMPLSEARGDEKRGVLLTASLRALKGLLTKGVDRVDPVVGKMVENWGGEVRRGRMKALGDAQAALGEIAVRVGRMEIAKKYVEMGGQVGDWVVKEIVRGGGKDVAWMWLDGWMGGDGHVLRYVVECLKDEEAICEKLVAVGKRTVGKGCVHVLRELVTVVRERKGCEAVVALVDAFDQMNERERQQLAAVLYYAHVVCFDAVVKAFLRGFVEIEPALQCGIEQKSTGWMDAMAAIRVAGE